MKLIAHRGYSDLYPENTMLAFKEAINKGFDGIETDVHKTKDGYLVLCHDEKIDRTSDGKGYIKDITYQELLKYNFNNKMEGMNQKIPLLEQLLDLCKNENIILDIELKTDKIMYSNLEQEVYDMVKDKGLLENVIFSSFNINSLFKMREIDSRLYLGYLYEDNYQKNKQLTIKNNFHAHPKEIFLNDEEIEDYLSAGLDINTWTIKSEFRCHYLFDLGVNMIISNKYFK